MGNHKRACVSVDCLMESPYDGETWLRYPFSREREGFDSLAVVWSEYISSGRSIYAPVIASYNEKCTICGLMGTMIICDTGTNCTGVYHPQCLPTTDYLHTLDWSCQKCTATSFTNQPRWLEPLTTQELHLIPRS